MTAALETTDSAAGLAGWREGVLGAFADALPMFGVESCEVVPRAIDADRVAGAYIAIEGNTHTYYIGVLDDTGSLVQLAALLLGPIGEAAPATAEVHDAVREIANIVAGGAKSRLLASHGRLVLGLPFVAEGVLRHGISEPMLVALAAGPVSLCLSVDRAPHSPEKLRALELERELAAQEARLRSIMQAAADGIVTLDAAGCIDLANPAAAALLGFGAADAHGVAFAACVPTWKASTGEHGGCMEAVVRRRDGSEIPIELSLSPLSTGGKGGMVAILRDVRERRQIESELRRAQKMESIGRLAAGLAHEINTPVQFVGDSLDFVRGAGGDLLRLCRAFRHGIEKLQDSKAYAEVAAALETEVVAADLDFLVDNLPASTMRARQGLDRIAGIVAAMRSFAQPSDGAPTPDDVNDVVRVTLAVGAAELRGKAEVETLFGELPPVPCHRGELGQAFLALLQNAVQAIAQRYGGNQSGHIAVCTRAVAGGIEVAIRDDGCGIPAAIADRVFDPFFTTRDVGSQGQGLTQARAVIESRHGGRLSFTSREGEGTEFTVFLPASTPAA